MRRKHNPESILHQARSLQHEDRERYLSQACGSDPGLRAEVDALLLAEADAGSFLAPVAEQREPVVRRVALKIVKLGMDTRRVIAL